MLEAAATWILTYALHSMVLGAIALIVLPRARISPAMRCMLWRAAIFAPLLTTSFAVVSRAPVSGARPLGVVEPIRRVLPPRWGRVESLVDVRVVNGGRPVRAEKLIDPLATMAAAFLTGLVFILALLGGAVMVRRGYVARRFLQLDHTAQAGLDEIIGRDIVVSISQGTRIPLALTGRRICVPADDFGSLGAGERAAVLLHEVAHVERRDPEWIGAARVICALTRWQPLNFRILGALERDAELAADEHAVKLGARPDALVAGLAWFASRLQPGPVPAGVPLLRSDSSLVRRARRILAPVETLSRVHGFVAGLAVAAAFALLLALPVATPAAPALAPPTGAGATHLNVRKIEFLRAGQPPR